MNEANAVYLCQVSESLSCGACCGLYNLPDLSREKLENLLWKRTEAFAAVPRTENGIYEFHRKYEGPPSRLRPFPDFYHCPFLGLIGDQKKRVGCLLHPAVAGNDGVDYRSFGWYGEQACRTYFCPATRKMSAVYQTILIECIADWYVFGLLVTEHVLVTAYFREVESRIRRHVTVSDYSRNIEAKHVFREFAQLRLEWPYRRKDRPGPCNFFFDNGLYQRPGVLRTAHEIRQSTYENIFGELDSGFTSVEEIETAEQLLDDLFFKSERALVAP